MGKGKSLKSYKMSENTFSLIFKGTHTFDPGNTVTGSV